MDLSERQRHILYEFLNEENQMYTAEELANKYKVSKRTIYNDLQDIREWISSKGLELCIKPGTGIWVNREKNDQETICKIKNELSDFKPYITPLSKEERVKAIISILLKESDTVTISDICSRTGISRTTFYNDLNDVENWFKRFDLDVVRTQKKGVALEGDEDNKREAIISFLTENLDESQMLSLLEINNNYANTMKKPGDNIVIDLFSTYLSNINLEPIKIFVNESQKALGYRFTDSAFLALVVHIAMAVKRIKDGFNITIDEQKLNFLKQNPEYEISKLLSKKIEKEYEVAIPEAEVGYITLHLLSGKINQSYKEELNPSLNNCVATMIETAGSILGMDLSNDEELSKGLNLHLSATYNRLMLEIEEKNPLKDIVLEKYAQLYSTAKIMAEVFEKDTGYSLDDDEISYIMMYLGAAIERAKGTQTKKVYAVCPTGLGGAQLLVANLKNKFPDIVVKGTISMSEAESLNDPEVDAIISTVNFKNDNFPVISVSPFVSETDMVRIYNVLNVETSKFQSKRSANNLKIANKEEIPAFISIISDLACFVDRLKNKLAIKMSNETYLGLIIHLALRLSLSSKEKDLFKGQPFKLTNDKSEVDSVIYEEVKDLCKKYPFTIMDEDILAIKTYMSLNSEDVTK